MRLVHESYYQYEDNKFFSILESKLSDTYDEKLAKEQEKDGQEIIKKVKDNWQRFKSFAGKKVQEYKKFHEEQEKMLQMLKTQNPSIQKLYKLYDSSFVVLIKTIDGKNTICVYNTNPENNDENLIVNINNKSVIQAFIDFKNDVKKDNIDMIQYYKENIESKEKEEKYKKQREKLDSFLKESKK